MARKRFGRTLTTIGGARRHAYSALVAGSDHADLAGSCQSPVMVAITGLRDTTLAGQAMLRYETAWPGTDYAPGIGWLGDKPEKHPSEYGEVVNVDLAVRCRKCPACLKARAALWRRRAVAECLDAQRTWFVTLTLDPARQFYCVNAARAALAEQGLQWDLLQPDDRFREQCKPLIREFQLFMKRLRKGCKGLRYFLVVERHKSGDPHLHLLLHETLQPVRWKAINAAWHWGFHKSNLVDDARSAANYAAKYLTKSAACRIRASVRYGASADHAVTIHKDRGRF